MQLRDYQIKLINDIYTAWDSGHQNVLGQLATGGGKTVILSKIVSDFKAPSVIIAHRCELVSQISITLARFGIRHNIVAQKSTIRDIIQLHHLEFKKSFFSNGANVIVASVDSLKSTPPWASSIRLVVIDEAAHVLAANKWGKAAALFPHAKGFFPTATPCRADGIGLGRGHGGIMDILIQGVSMQELMQCGFLTKYKIFAPYTAMDLSGVSVGRSGDYSLAKLRHAVHESKIVGDVVEHYKKIAMGKLGITFAVDIEHAIEISREFNENGIKSAVISSRTPDLERHATMKRFRKREILQIVNVDILGEGVDVPAVEVVSMARPTESYSLFAQQFGRALRPSDGKTHAIIIDHVSNCKRHGLPDMPRVWTLEGRSRKRMAEDVTVTLALKTCQNCTAVFDRFIKMCPNCGNINKIIKRSAPEFVDGDLLELDLNVLNDIRRVISFRDGPAKLPRGVPFVVQRSIEKNHERRKIAQTELRDIIAQWAGIYKAKGDDDSMIYRRFYHLFNIDILTAQTLYAKDAIILKDKIAATLGT